MMVITIANPKGGVGKTTTTINLAYLLAQTKKTLIYDLDTQSAYQIFFDTIKKAKNLYKTQFKNLDIFVHKKIEKELFNDYDIVLIDTPATLKKEVKKSIKISNLTIIPTLPHVLAIQMYNSLIKVKDQNIKLLLNGVANNPYHKKIIKLILNLPSNQYFKTYIPKDEKIENIFFTKKPYPHPAYKKLINELKTLYPQLYQQ